VVCCGRDGDEVGEAVFESVCAVWAAEPSGGLDDRVEHEPFAGVVDCWGGAAGGEERAFEGRPIAYVPWRVDLTADARLKADLAGELLEYAGLDASAAAVEAMRSHAERPLAAMDDHRTTADPRASIGRWRRDLSPQLAETCERALAAELHAFGYTA
jgi:hypothetical protein